MQEIIERKKCTGCTACYSACPKNAISMVTDEEGFKHPVIDQEKCINCGLCKKICPVLNTLKNESINKCYAAYNLDKQSLKTSSSGGIFELIANSILEENGIVIGAAFDENNKLKHIAVEKKEELQKLKGSKYVQSDLNDIFSYVKENIKDKKVLFVGTPCQVAGIKAIIKNDNLICIDVVCHGVPSPKLFQKYINELETKNNDIVVNYNFREKKYGWRTYRNVITFSKKKIGQFQYFNNYMKLFLKDVAIRESCYQCNFKLGNKYSDITLGDFWYIENTKVKLYHKNGVSAVIINTQNGLDIFEKIKNNIKYEECNIKDIVQGNEFLKHPISRPKERDTFFNDLESKSFDELINKYYKIKNIRIAYWQFKNYIKRHIKLALKKIK